jgi:gluconate 2-dehydrogenase gamma chain
VFSPSPSSRRDFITTLTSALGSSLIVLSMPAIMTARAEASAARKSMAAFKTLSEEEAAEFEAIAARIIPTDETPGAREAGAIYFIDNVLGTSRTEELEPLRAGLASLKETVQSRYAKPSFHLLDPADQDALLKEIEATPFFATMRYLTIAGTFSPPEYGGNRDGIGWSLIGFEMQHMWQPPYGYYDAEYAREGR